MNVQLQLTEYEAALFNMVPRRAHFIEDQFHPAIIYCLGLNAELGELTQSVQRIFKNDGGVLTEERRQELLKEAGDVLAYLTLLLDEFKLTLVQTAFANLEKLHARAAQSRVFNKEQGDQNTMKILTSNAREVRALEQRIRRQYGLGYIPETNYRKLTQSIAALKVVIDDSVPAEVKERFGVDVSEEEGELVAA